jgi:hypothetical protein
MRMALESLVCPGRVVGSVRSGTGTLGEGGRAVDWPPLRGADNGQADRGARGGFAPLMSRSTSAFPRQSPSEPRARRRCDIEHLKCAAASSLPRGIAQRPDRDALSFTSAAFTRLCGRAVLATNRQPAHKKPLGRLCGQTTSATTSPFAGTFCEDRDAARTLDLLRIRQYLDRRARKSENRRFAGTSSG